MSVNLKGRSFLTLMDFSSEEIRYLLDLGHELKAKKKSPEAQNATDKESQNEADIIPF